MLSKCCPDIIRAVVVREGLDIYCLFTYGHFFTCPLVSYPDALTLLLCLQVARKGSHLVLLTPTNKGCVSRIEFRDKTCSV